MTLKDLQDEVNFYTGEMSVLIRNLCFSGIAVTWMFKINPQTYFLLIAFLFFVAGLLFDFIFLGYSARKANETFNAKENELKQKNLKSLSKKEREKDFLDREVGGWSKKIPRNKRILRWIKVFFCFGGYVCVGAHIVLRVIS